jgi:hypothetical protein
MKADRKIFKGIEYVQLQELPPAQQDKLASRQDLFIKIMIDGKVVGQCIQYKDYQFWYENVFKTRIAVVKEARISEVAEIEPNLVLNKY